MGDRATIRIQQGEDNVAHLYTHWGGYRVKETLAEALQRCIDVGRLTDEAYASRIIFDTLTGCEGGDTGYGIMLGENPPGDIGHWSPSVEWREWGMEPVIRFRKFDGTFTEDQTVQDFLSSVEATV